MDIQKLTKQIKKEAKANPGRTAVLAIVTLVAIYFWAPLLTKLVGGGNKPAANPPVTTAPSGEPVAVVANSSTSLADAFPWRRFLEMVRNDSHLASATLPELQHNPFAELEPPMASTAVEVEGKAAPISSAPEIPFDQLGLRLESTLVSSHGGVAMISGKMYTLKKNGAARPTLAVEHAGRPIEVTLTDVRQKQVELDYRGTRHMLSIDSDPNNNSTIERH